MMAEQTDKGEQSDR